MTISKPDFIATTYTGDEAVRVAELAQQGVPIDTIGSAAVLLADDDAKRIPGTDLSVLIHRYQTDLRI